MNGQGIPYSFVTRWQVEAPIDRVWDALFDADAYPRWWSSVLSATELEKGGPDGLGKVGRFVWKAPLGYRLRFDLRLTTVDRPTRFGGPATGDLEGTGYWTLRGADGITDVRHDWNVRTNLGWMNFLAPLARPVFKLSHTEVMSKGAAGLADLLGVRVVQL